VSPVAIYRPDGRSEYDRVMALDRASVAYLSSLIGHKLAVRPRRADFVAVCSCGYTSAKRRTAKLAVGAAVHHQDVVTTAWQSSGKPWPVPTRDTPKEDVFEPRTTQVA